MKSVLLDHCVPRPFGKVIENCAVATAFERGWQNLKNGELIEAAELANVDILITADKNLRYQQNLDGRRIAIIELPTNRLKLVSEYAAQVNEIILTVQPGGYVVIEL